MVAGYARVDRPTQSLDKQLNLIKSVNARARIFADRFTTVRTKKYDNWNRLYDIVKEGDTIILESSLRLGSNAKQSIKLYKELTAKGVNLVFVNEPVLSTDTFRSELTSDEVKEFYDMVVKVTIVGAWTSYNNLTKAMRANLDSINNKRKKEGRPIGRPKGSTKETQKAKEKKKIILKVSRAFGGELTDDECIELLKIDRKTFYKYKKELQSQ